MQDFEQIYQTYFRDVYRFLLSLTRDADLAEELTAETFVRALASLDTFRGECGIRVWLCQIGKHCWYAHCRRAGRAAAPLSEEDAAALADPAPSVEDAFADRQTAMQLHRQLHALPEPYREVFSLRVFGELSFAQIGELFDKTENWACVTFHRAKKKLQDALHSAREGWNDD